VDEVPACNFKRNAWERSGMYKQGRTVLFVSHNMSTVESLCDRGILLELGSLCLDGTAEEAV